MNHAISGKPGAGKSMLGMYLIYQEVIKGNRPVLTDVAVEKLPWVTASHESRIGFLDYLHSKHNQTFDAADRVFRLTSEAMTNFFLYRALSQKQIDGLGSKHLVGYREVKPEDNVLAEGEWQHHKNYKLFVATHTCHHDKHGRKVVDSYETALTIASGGHLIVNDEAWQKYPARGWAGTAQAILYYFSFVRRFGDDNWLISQRFTDCDSILMDRCQDFWACTNQGKLRFLGGLFRRPNVLTVNVYDKVPNSQTDPQFHKTLPVDSVGLGQCYDTAGGIGTAGRVIADIGKRAQGLPMWVLPVVILLACWLGWKGVQWGMGYIRRLISPHNKAVQAVQKMNPLPTNGVSSVTVPVVTNVPPPMPVDPKQAYWKALYDVYQVSETNEICGFSAPPLVDRPTLYFSDGSLVDGTLLRDRGARWDVLIATHVYTFKVARPKPLETEKKSDPFSSHNDSTPTVFGSQPLQAPQSQQFVPQESVNVNLPSQPQSDVQQAQPLDSSSASSQVQGYEPLSRIHSFIGGNYQH